MINFILAFLILLFAVALIVGYLLSSPGYSGGVSDHFNGKKFVNAEAIKPKGFSAVLKWAITRKPGEWKESRNFFYGEKPGAQAEDAIRVTFVNHSTFLIQTEELNILTDPIWSDRASPFSWAGPRRMRPPGIRFEDLPTIDVVILSHNHYDHLDIPTLKKLSDIYHPVFIAPLGVKAFLNSKGITSVSEVDWWEEIKLNEAVIMQAVPAQHFSGRGLFDRDRTLWCGFVIKTQSGNLFFAGDTGYNEKLFQNIGQRFAPVRLALLPIGAYMPEWFMSAIHISPEEAVKTHLALKAETSIAMHFGTFPLGDDGQDDPVNDLEKAKKKYQIKQNEFLIIKEGASYEVKPSLATVGGRSA